jgi:hypothetical protein
MPRTGVSYSAGCEISKTQSFGAFSRPKITGLFLIFCTAAECEFPNCTFYRSLYLFYSVLLYRFRVWHDPVFRLASSSQAAAEIHGYRIKI